MRIPSISLLAALLIAASSPAIADDVANERARIANQRIQVEEQRRAREEAERLAQAQASREQASAAQAASAQEMSSRDVSEPAAPPSNDVASDVSAERMEMSRALEQLRELGALRDAGYVTEAEFEQLKKKILDAAL